MAVLPWGHSRSRTTSNEKRQNPAFEWFSRSGGAEPSRHALSLLMKEHTRSTSVGSSSMSRSSTAQSHHSKTSRSSRVTDNDEQESERSAVERSRPVTPQLPEIRPTSPSYSLASALELFGRSGSLKRKSSKMSLNSEATASTTVVSPSRLGPSRLGFRRKESPASPTRSESKAPTISQPFAFRHITHSDQSHFNGLSKIDESELASQFGVVQASQHPQLTLKGIQAEKLPQIPYDRPCSPSPQSGGAELPMTPPRPAPPPKDSPHSHLPKLEVRMSRSMENFSRPTSRSPSSPVAASPGHIKTLQLPNLAEADESLAEQLIKPLPHLPSMVHAVSTMDDTAQCMKSAPLPSPPSTQDPFTTSPQRQAAGRGSLRHMSTFPSPRQQQQRFSSFIPETRLMDIMEEKERIPRHKSEDALTRYINRFSQHLSVTPKKEDWEDAIEYAWDHADDQSLGGDDSSDSTSTAARPAKRDSMISVSHTSHRSASNYSTPLMMGDTTHQRPCSPTSSEDHGELHTSSSDQKFGLGINSTLDSPSSARQLGPPSLGLNIPGNSDHEGYQLPRTTYSAISKSSSQESIILSIASSILGTQRSSNSSVSPSELSRLSRCDEPVSAATSAPSPLLTVDHQKAARPESTCVPMSLLKGFVPASSDPKPTTFDHDNQSHGSEAEDEVTPLASEIVNDPSLSDVSAPTSPRRNVALSKVSPRKRSSTQTSRHSARASYSLFPTASS